MYLDKAQYTIRLETSILGKIKKIAELEKRSTNLQVEYVLENFVKDYEKDHGPIYVPEEK